MRTEGKAGLWVVEKTRTEDLGLKEKIGIKSEEIGVRRKRKD